MLKSFLGENNLTNCEVMIKDVTDSKRIYSRFNEEYSHREFNFKSILCSQNYWPKKLSQQNINLGRDE